MRTDTERLDYLLAIIEAQDDDAAEKLSAALTLGLKGRPMVDAAMGAKLVEPGKPMPELTAIDLAVAELGRIRNVKGYSEERDDAYPDDDLAFAAAHYLVPRAGRATETHDRGYLWPWDESTFKPSPDDRKKELTKGIALALCELDRLIRAERRVSLEMQAQVCAEMNEAACEPEVSPREFKVGDRVICNDPDYGGMYKDARGEIVSFSGNDLYHVNLELREGTLAFTSREMRHVDG
jgi:hypothetical protein